jgi:hypothetical protein
VFADPVLGQIRFSKLGNRISCGSSTGFHADPDIEVRIGIGFFLRCQIRPRSGSIKRGTGFYADLEPVL